MKDYRTQPAAAIPKTQGVEGGRKWSVVIPAYNEEQYLATTLASITALSSKTHDSEGPAAELANAPK